MSKNCKSKISNHFLFATLVACTVFHAASVGLAQDAGVSGGETYDLRPKSSRAVIVTGISVGRTIGPPPDNGANGAGPDRISFEYCNRNTRVVASVNLGNSDDMDMSVTSNNTLPQGAQVLVFFGTDWAGSWTVPNNGFGAGQTASIVLQDASGSVDYTFEIEFDVVPADSVTAQECADSNGGGCGCSDDVGSTTPLMFGALGLVMAGTRRRRVSPPQR